MCRPFGLDTVSHDLSVRPWTFFYFVVSIKQTDKQLKDISIEEKYVYDVYDIDKVELCIN